MPLFIFIAGYLTKKIVKQRKKEIEQVLYTYLVFELLNLIFTKLTSIGWGGYKCPFLFLPLSLSSSFSSWQIPQHGFSGLDLISRLNCDLSILWEKDIQAGSKPDQAEPLPSFYMISLFYPAHNTPGNQSRDLDKDNFAAIPCLKGDEVLFIAFRGLVQMGRKEFSWGIDNL